MIVIGQNYKPVTGAAPHRRGLGFLPSGGDVGGGMDWFDWGFWFDDYFSPDYGYLWGGQDKGQGGGAIDYSWLDNFDPITGDWIGNSGSIIDPIVTNQKYLPPAPAGNWWQGLIDFFSGIISPNYQPVYDNPTPSPPGGGLCPDGFYSPTVEPLNCIPIPPDAAQPGGSTAQKQPATVKPGPMTRPGSAQPQPPKCSNGQIFSTQYNRCVPKCAAGQVYNPSTNKCQAAPKCPDGYQFDQSKGTCVKAAQASAGLPWWVWLLIAGGVVAATSGNDKPQRRTRAKR